ncbi:MAG: PilN domain-containing protein [Myxococcales bacterium]|nr:PilN domain-containing protein [Myxococcales bacterium]
MIAMIRINLLPARTSRKKRGGKQILILLAVILALEGIALFYWHQSTANSLAYEQAKVKDLEAKVADLNKIKAQIDEREKYKETLIKQNFIFEELKYDKIGPANALIFLSYVLTKKEDNIYNVDEIKAQEESGWDVNWDPNRLWLVDFVETEKDVTIIGHATSHDDVTEFYRRLDSSLYFYDIRPDVQEVKYNDEIDVKFVRFTVDAKINYDLEGIPRPAPVVASAEKPADEAGNKAKKEKKP